MGKEFYKAWKTLKRASDLTVSEYNSVGRSVMPRSRGRSRGRRSGAYDPIRKRFIGQTQPSHKTVWPGEAIRRIQAMEQVNDRYPNNCRELFPGDDRMRIRIVPGDDIVFIREEVRDGTATSRYRTATRKTYSLYTAHVEYVSPNADQVELTNVHRQPEQGEPIKCEDGPYPLQEMHSGVWRMQWRSEMHRDARLALVLQAEQLNGWQRHKFVHEVGHEVVYEQTGLFINSLEGYTITSMAQRE